LLASFVILILFLVLSDSVGLFFVRYVDLVSCSFSWSILRMFRIVFFIRRTMIRLYVTLLRVLTHRFGVTGPALTWFSSYLTGRTTAYHHNDQRSQIYAVNCSVPQGRFLRPQEFTAYTEELVVLIDGFHISHHLYADDTHLHPEENTD